jgi:hypothetical protein
VTRERPLEVFEGWPARLAGSAGGAAIGLLTTIAVLALACFYGLKGLGNAFEDWNPRDTVEGWIGVSGLNYVAAGAVLWYAIFRRWPAAPPSQVGQDA